MNIHRQIIKAAQQGNRKAQKELYELYAKAMYNISVRMLQDADKAQDCLQEAFIDAFTHLDQFDFRIEFGGWLKRLVINRCINEIKRSKRSDDFIGGLDSDDHHEEVETENKELKLAAIREAIKQLPNGSRAIFSMYALEGYDHVEIAEVLDISESTSKSQYMRAKNRIKAILQNQII